MGGYLSVCLPQWASQTLQSGSPWLQCYHISTSSKNSGPCLTSKLRNHEWIHNTQSLWQPRKLTKKGWPLKSIKSLTYWSICNLTRMHLLSQKLLNTGMVVKVYDQPSMINLLKKISGDSSLQEGRVYIIFPISPVSQLKSLNIYTHTHT